MNAVAEPLPARKAALRALPALGSRVDADARSGAAAMLAMLVGFVPLGCLVGVAVAGSVQPPAAWAGVWLIFSGSAHLTVIQLVDSGAGAVTAVLTALMVNARLLLFSATLAPYWRGTSLRTRLLAAATLVDPTWMVATPRFAHSPDPAAGRRFYFGAGAVLWVGWAAAVTLGAAAGTVIPAGAGLDLLAPLCLMSLLSTRLRTVPGAAGAAAAAVVAAVSVRLPGALGLLVSVAAGTAAATLVRSLRKGRDR
jgi:predicted branched-subunit amino acid permease